MRTEGEMGMTEQEKRENVIKGLGSCVEYFANKVKGVMFDEWLEESRKAIALLKAQEPVEPVFDKGESDDPWGRLFFCGACGRRINEKYNPDEDDKYCKHCGRPVKWG